jgi:excisionase family DNA binding protein
MKRSADEQKLGQAVENLAATIVEVIGSRLRQLAERERLLQPEHLAERRTEWEGWVDQKTAAEHLKVSRRTLFNWMQKGVIPHVRLGGTHTVQTERR